MSVMLKRILLNARYLWKTGKPRVALRYIHKIATAKLLKRVGPRQIDIALTFKCNLQCEHCFATPLYRSDGQEMSYVTLKKVADECLRLGITVIHFTGGEILLRDDLEEVIKLFHPEKNIIYVQSNGLLASKERLASLKAAGLDFFSVSLEASNADTQDKFRKHRGYFDSVLGNLAVAREVGLQTSVNLTIDNKFIHSPELPLLIDRLGKLGHVVYANLPVPVGRYQGNHKVLWGARERMRLNGLSGEFPHFRTEFDSNFGPRGCPAMKEKIYLCAYGDVIACPYIHIQFGNVKDEPLSDIRQRCLSYRPFNTYADHCLAAENTRFIEEYIHPTYEEQTQPVSYLQFIDQMEDAPNPVPIEIYARNRYLDIPLAEAACEFCGPARSELLTSARDYETDFGNVFSVRRCTSCGLLFTSPRPSMEDLFKHFYADSYVCYRSDGVVTRLREHYLNASRYRRLKRLVPPKVRFLDVGCSYGAFIQFLDSATDWEVYGCEPQPEMADTARRQGLEVETATLVEAGYPDNFFDVVYMSHVLEHVPDVRATIREAIRILRPGGLFITENPDIDAPSRSFFKEAWWGYHLPRHLTHFSKKSMATALSSVGFQVLSSKPCFRPGPIAWSIQNKLKDKGHSSLTVKALGLSNPFFVASMTVPAAIQSMMGHSEMMETIARKPRKQVPETEGDV